MYYSEVCYLFNCQIFGVFHRCSCYSNFIVAREHIVRLESFVSLLRLVLSPKYVSYVLYVLNRDVYSAVG